MSDTQSKILLYQAQGYLMGELERSEASNYLVLTDGDRLRVDTIRASLRPKLALVPPDENSRIWGVYPRTKRDGTVSSLMLYALPMVTVAVGFTVAGQVIYCGENLITVSIHRNQQPPAGKEHQRSWQPSLITLNGALPDLRCWQYWRFQCELKDGRLMVMDGVKAVEVPPRPAQVKVNPVPPAPEAALPLAESAPPRPQRTFDLSRR